jgi:hypothetical protein
MDAGIINEYNKTYVVEGGVCLGVRSTPKQTNKPSGLCNSYIIWMVIGLRKNR